MAKFLPSEIIGSIRNKLGASVFTVNRGGACIRAYQPVVSQPPSVSRDARQAALRSLWPLWLGTLTEAQRIAWGRMGAVTWRRDVLAQRYNLAGANHFMAVNLMLDILGYGPVLDAPVGVPVTDPGPLVLVADSVSQTLTVHMNQAPGFDTQPLIRMTGPLSPGRNNLSGSYRVLPIGGIGPLTFDIDLYPVWSARYGPIPQDVRIGLTLQYVNIVTGSLSQEQIADVVSTPQEVEQMLVRKVTIPAVDFRNLLAVPFQLLAAPGIGLSILPIIGYFRTHNTVIPWAGASDLVVCTPPQANSDFWLRAQNAGVTYALAVDGSITLSSLGGSQDVPSLLVNRPISLTVSALDFTGGDAPVDVILYYVVVPTP